MSKIGAKLYPEDRIITSLEIVRYRLVRTICEIDKQIEYLERHKGNRKGI